MAQGETAQLRRTRAGVGDGVAVRLCGIVKEDGGSEERRCTTQSTHGSPRKIGADLDPARSLIDLQRTVSIRRKKATTEDPLLIVNTPKSGRLRIVDCPAALMAQLQERRSIAQAEAAVAGRPLAPWAFPAAIDPTRPLNASWFWRHVWSPLLEKAAVRAIRIHDARHTYASLMLRRGVPIAYVSRQVGHSSIQITADLYGHFVPGGDRHHAEGLAAAIEAERVAAEARVLSLHPNSFPAPDGTLVAPGGAVGRGDGGQVRDVNGAPGVTRTPGTQFRK